MGNAGRPDVVTRLTPRELDVFQLVVRGLSNQQIAAKLCLVKTHVARILTKLGVRDRVRPSVVLAHEAGIVRFDG